MNTKPKLRVEEPKVETKAAAASPAPDLDHWKKLAITTGERLQYAENQLNDLRQAADEARARFSKYKERLDRANQRVNELQIDLVKITAERDDLRSQVAKQEKVSQLVHQYRQSLLEGPLWDLFTELAVCPPATTLSGGSVKS